MNPFSERPVEILDDWNEILRKGCCCEMPECADPILECESLTGGAEPEGIEGPYNEPYRIHTKQTTRWVYAVDRTTYGVLVSDGVTPYVTSRTIGSANRDFINEWKAVGDGLANAATWVDGCYHNTPDYLEYCEGGGSSTQTTYQAWFMRCGGVETSGVETIHQGSMIILAVGGQDDGVGGKYPDCWFKHTFNSSEYHPCHSCDPDYCSSRGLPTTEIYDELIFFGQFPNLYFGTDSITYLPSTLDDGMTWNEWVDQAYDHLIQKLNWDNEDCSKEVGFCFSEYDHEPEPVDRIGGTPDLELRKTRFRWNVPDEAYLYFHVTWDIGFFPPKFDEWLAKVVARETWEAAVAVYEAWEIAHAAWQDEYAEWEIAHAAWEVIQAAWEVEYEAWLAKYEAYQTWLDGERDTWPPEEPGDAPELPPEPVAPVEPDEPAPPGPEVPPAPPHTDETQPLPIAKDQTWEWIGIVDPEDPDTSRSEWYFIDVPDLPGQHRIVNIRFRCYRETPYGNAPQITGDGIEWPEEPDP